MKIERTVLPCGGWVEFRDPSEITGRDYRRLQAAQGNAVFVGQAEATIKPLLAEILIEAWEVPYLPLGGRMVPAADPTLLDQVKINDLMVIDKALQPVRIKIVQGERLDDVDPPTPQTP